MCFQIIPLCPACEDPSGLGEEVIFAEDVCGGDCAGDDVCGTATRPLTRAELAARPDFECLTPGCPGAAGGLASPAEEEEEEAEVQGAREAARRFLRARHEGCLSLCILPFCEAARPEVVPHPELSDSDAPQPRQTPSAARAKPKRGRPDRPWSKKRGKPWCLEEEAILWKLRRRGMDFDEIATHIDRTERGCYDRYNKLRNEGFGRSR